MSFKTYRLPPLSPSKPESLVVFLHGLGDSGSGGLLDIGRMWQSTLPRTEFLCPDAPFAYDMAPSDFGGRQWFSLKDFTTQAIEEGVRQAAPLLNEFIDQTLSAYGLEPSRLALVGFSQGTMMALYVALRRRVPVAAVIGYSGMLVGAETMAQTTTAFPPVLLVHGMMDDVVPYTSQAAAEQALRHAHVSVETVSSPQLGHSIDERGLQAGLSFLQRHLTAAATHNASNTRRVI
jgi:phospholipase/carboxylesterase